MERIPPPKPRRDEDALREAVGAEPHGARLRSPGRRTPGPSRRAERLHRTRHTCHRARGISASGERGSPGCTPFAQQSPLEATLQPGDVVRVYKEGNTAEDSLDPGGGYAAHSFIVVSVEGGDIQV